MPRCVPARTIAFARLAATPITIPFSSQFHKFFGLIFLERIVLRRVWYHFCSCSGVAAFARRRSRYLSWNETGRDAGARQSRARPCDLGYTNRRGTEEYRGVVILEGGAGVETACCVRKKKRKQGTESETYIHGRAPLDGKTQTTQ